MSENANLPVKSKGLSFMPRQMQEKIVIVQNHVRATPMPDRCPSPATDHIHAVMADLCRQDRAKVAGCGPQPAAPRILTCSVRISRPQAAPPSERGRLKPTTQSAYPVQAGSYSSEIRRADEARAAATRRSIAEEEETRAAIGRFRPFLRVAAISVSPPRVKGPDPGGGPSNPPGRPPVPNGAIKAST